MFAEQVADAEAALKAVGLVPVIVHGRDYIGVGLIVGISPAPGTVVNVGSTVTLTIV